MDIAALFAQFGPWGAALVLALAGAKWVSVRLEKSESRASDLAALALKRCDEERVMMTAKLDKLEDRIAAVYEDTINKSTSAMEATVDTLRRFCDIMDRNHR